MSRISYHKNLGISCLQAPMTLLVMPMILFLENGMLSISPASTSQIALLPRHVAWFVSWTMTVEVSYMSAIP